MSWGAVIDEGDRESCEGFNAEELKFLKTLSIYELEIFAVDLALHVLERENLVNSNIVLHVDNVGACFAIRKGAGCKSAAAISAANATKVLGSRGRQSKIVYVSTKRNPADIVSRIGRLKTYQNVRDRNLNKKLGKEFLPSYVADLARKSHNLFATFQNDIRSTAPNSKLQREGPSAAAAGAPPTRSSSSSSPLPTPLP